MRAKSASSLSTDPYRAGWSLGWSLAEIKPEVVLLFAASHLENWAECMEGLYDGLGDPTIQVLGADGDGIYGDGRAFQVGISALGLSSEGAVRWHVVSRNEVIAAPASAVRSAKAELDAKMAGATPAFYLLFCDARVDASLVEEVIHDEIAAPVVGGMAGTDATSGRHGKVFHNRTALADSLVMLAAEGDIRFAIHVGNTVKPVGEPGIVESSTYRSVARISGVDALQFVERAIGKPIMRSDQGIALSILDAEAADERKLRAVDQTMVSADGVLTLHGGIKVNQRVQICISSAADVAAGASRAAREAAAEWCAPEAVLMLSCAGRKWMLGGHLDVEVEAVADAFGHALPAAGFCSLGEIGPMRHAGGFTRNLFHNMSFILLLLGK